MVKLANIGLLGLTMHHIQAAGLVQNQLQHLRGGDYVLDKILEADYDIPAHH